AGEHAGELELVEARLLDQAPRDIWTHVVPVPVARQERGDVVQRDAAVPQGPAVDVDLGRPDVLHQRPHGTPERVIDVVGQLERVQSYSTGDVHQRALPVVGRDEQDEIALLEALLQGGHQPAQITDPGLERELHMTGDKVI